MTFASFPTHSKYDSPAEMLEGRSGPKQRPLMLIDHDRPAFLTWENLPASENGLTLQLSPVVERIGSKTRDLCVYSGDTLLASLEVMQADPYQILSLPIPREAIPASGPLTLRLQLRAGEKLWLFAPESSTTDGLEYHVPRLIPASITPSNFIDRLCSLASIQNFGWKEGCVLDGIHALGDSRALRQHLDYYGFSTGDLVCETPQSIRAVNTINTIESTLPFAHAALIDPHHPWIKLVIKYWEDLVAENGGAWDDYMISAEGAYTVAYPMTLIARLLGQERWMKVAEESILKTYSRLVLPDGVYLRSYRDGRMTYRNWARGLCWLLLGHVQTLRHQPHRSDQVMAQFHTLAKIAARHQMDDGLWSCFMDGPHMLAETSGSAGIAAAFAIAVNEGWLDASYRERAARCRAALQMHITSEGFLGHCSQSNKGSEEDQRGTYRVTLPYALGMLGNLEAALRANSVSPK